MRYYQNPDFVSSRDTAQSPVRTTPSTTVPPRALRPYEFIGTPAITLVLDAIAARCRVGGCITPGVRQIAEWANVSPGLVSPSLYQLAEDGWISYDGRVISLLIDPAQPIDQQTDQTDQRADRSDADQQTDRSFMPTQPSDQRADRFDAAMVLTTTRFLDPVVAVESSGGMQGGDQPGDRPAARLMAELGANPLIIAEAFAARSDWTAPQVRARWEYDQRRIALSGGKLNEGIFFTALRCGELAPFRPEPDRPLNPADYAGQPGFVLGGSDPPGETEPESIRDHAARLLPAPTARTIRDYTRDWLFLQGRLAADESDAQALAALDAYRQAVRR